VLVVHFLIDTPVVAFLLLLALLVTVGPIVTVLLSRKKTAHPDTADAPVKKPQNTRFLGTQPDLVILIFGLLLLLALAGWVYKTFFE
jgi:hypothetical protein